LPKINRTKITVSCTREDTVDTILKSNKKESAKETETGWIIPALNEIIYGSN